MLRYNFSRMLAARGISRPYSYLVQASFSDKIATGVKNNTIRRMDLNILERLCLLLNCTPNDVLEWLPDENYVDNQDHALNEIRQRTKVTDIVKTLNAVPAGKLGEIAQMINEKLNETDSC